MAGLGIDWDFTLLEGLFSDRGDKVLHERAVPCPQCRNDSTFNAFAQPDGRPGSIRALSCSSCMGDGFLYRDPQVVTGLITALHPGKRQLTDIGYAMPGDAVFSPSLSTRSISDYDRITLTVASSIDGQVIMRGAAAMGTNAMLETDLEANQDRLWYLPETAIWCEDQNGVIYTQNVDYIFDGKKLTWVGNTPLDGTLYSIKYRGYTEWVSYSSPMERYDQARDLAAKVMLRKKHVYFQNGLKADTADARKEQADAFTSYTKV